MGKPVLRMETFRLIKSLPNSQTQETNTVEREFFSRLYLVIEKVREPARKLLIARIETAVSEILYLESATHKPVLNEVSEQKASRLLTPDQVSQFLNIPKAWIYKHQNEMPVRRFGKYLRFPEKELLRWAEKRQAI